MRRSSITALIVAVAIVAVIVLYFATRPTASAPKSSPSPSANAMASPSASASPSSSSQAANPGAVVLTYTASGFSPASVTVTSGQQLTVRNSSNQAIQFDSNPHPVHTDDPELNIGPIAAGASATVTLNKMGTFGVHNHFNPSQQATVTIK